MYLPRPQTIDLPNITISCMISHKRVRERVRMEQYETHIGHILSLIGLFSDETDV